jgi:hypothetical protein
MSQPGQVVQPPGRAADLLLRPLDRRFEVRRVPWFGRPERQALGERRPGRIARLGDAEVGARLFGAFAELLVGQRIGRR